jgi:hypothetical protein
MWYTVSFYGPLVHCIFTVLRRVLIPFSRRNWFNHQYDSHADGGLRMYFAAITAVLVAYT